MSQSVAQLESLKYRTTQIMESITALQFLIEANGQPVMPSWPDILARYNLLLSQTHSLSVSLSATIAHHPLSQSQLQQSGAASAQNPLQKLALHPNMAVPEQQLDHALAPLLRNQPTVQVIKEEDASVRRIATILKTEAPDGPERFEQVVQECTEIRRAHDARIERAIKAVALLRDRYEWRARVDSEDVDNESGDGEEQENVGIKDKSLRTGGGDGSNENADVIMREQDIHAGDEKAPVTGSSPASDTEEANEAREAEDVLGMEAIPG